MSVGLERSGFHSALVKNKTKGSLRIYGYIRIRVLPVLSIE